jgi:hypothetical protein
VSKTKTNADKQKLQEPTTAPANGAGVVDAVDGVEKRIARLTLELAQTIGSVDCLACRRNMISYVHGKVVREALRPDANKACDDHAEIPERA